MNILKYRHHTALELGQELENLIFDMQAHGPDVWIPEHYTTLLMEIDIRLRELELYV